MPGLNGEIGSTGSLRDKKGPHHPKKSTLIQKKEPDDLFQSMYEKREMKDKEI